MPLIVRIFRDGRPIHELPFWAYLVVSEECAAGIEITHCINVLADFVANELLPLFVQFFV
jgi:hypothetical protein